MSQTLQIGNTSVETFSRENCGTCGVTWFVPEGFIEGRRRNGQLFYCPNGHSWTYTETREQKLQKQLDAATARCSKLDADLSIRTDQRDFAERRIIATRGLVTRLKRRVRDGVCPCCSKRFDDMAAHMQASHPGFAKEDAR